MDILSTLLDFIVQVEKYYWEFVGFILVIIVGFYLSIRSRFLQVRIILNVVEYFRKIINGAKKNQRGVNPIQLIFASTGGMIGIGNVVGVSSAILIGGPGAIVWLWIGVFFGMIVKYSEISLALKTRIMNDQNSYNGGLMFYVDKAFKNSSLTKITTIAVLIYSVEIYQFTVITDTIQSNLNIDRTLIVSVLLILVWYSTIGGIKRLANICSIMMPTFILMYLITGSWIIFSYVEDWSEIFKLIFSSSISGQSAIGGFAGSSFILTAYNGVSRAVYAGDIGIGYDSIVQSESSSVDSKGQSAMSVYCLILNGLICSVSMLLIIVTGAWKNEFVHHSYAIPMIFSNSFSYGKYFIGSVLFLAGFTTVISFLTVGFKAAEFLSREYGRKLYLVYAFTNLYIFSYASQEKLALLMSLCAGILLTINLCAIIKLRKDIEF